MNKKIFNPENFGMVICLCCDGHGYIRNPERQCCLKCGGFGFIKKEANADKNIATRNPLHANHILGEE
ncbi:MAG: hypothetical protein ACLQGU_08550 [bacterium]